MSSNTTTQAQPLTALTTRERQTISAEALRPRILATVSESPGMGAYEVAAALGGDGRRIAWTLQRMRDAGLVVAHEMPNRRVGRPVRVWFVAPAGTPRRPRRESAAAAEDRRRRDRISQQRRRARLAGKTITPEPLDRPRVYLPAPPPAWDMPAGPACRDADPRLFFGPELEAPQARAVRVAAAKAVCSTCPVQRSCLDGALTRGERWGVWAGVDLEVKGSASRRAPKAVRPGA